MFLCLIPSIPIKIYHWIIFFVWFEVWFLFDLHCVIVSKLISWIIWQLCLCLSNHDYVIRIISKFIYNNSNPSTLRLGQFLTTPRPAARVLPTKFYNIMASCIRLTHMFYFFVPRLGELCKYTHSKIKAVNEWKNMWMMQSKIKAAILLHSKS